uniref:Neck protein n=1 Tax=Serratia phage Kevin TaxID=3161161 RepID=A0AAU8KZU6_9CAUD
MATSKYFNYGNHVGTQRLIEDLVAEMIQQRGVDAKYLPRCIIDKNPILNESDHQFKEAIELEIYIEEIMGFNDLMWDKFGGLQMQDEVTFTLSQKRWREVVATSDARDQTPQEGDIIWLPTAGKAYKVNNINNDDDFLQYGKYYTYHLKCTLFQFGNEDIETGDDEIDDIDTRLQKLDDNNFFQDTLKEMDNMFNEEIEKDISVDKTRLDFGDK